MNVVDSKVDVAMTSGDAAVGAIDLMIALAKHKKKLIAFPLVAAIVAGAISMMLPDVFKASAKLLPPQQAQSGASALLSQLGGVAGVAAGASGLKNPSDLYIAMLKSRTVADRMIAKFDLKTVYQTPSQEAARMFLEGATSVSAGKDGLIVVEVESADPRRAAAMTNGYVDELLGLTRNMALTDAAQRRVFYEKQLEQAKNRLASAEVTLKRTLDARGVISVDSESRALVETGARLKAQISAKEIELNSLKAFVTPSNHEYRQVDEALRSLKAELVKLESGGFSDAAGALKPAPGGMESVKLMRDLKYYQMLYEVLAKQYEAARLEEAKDPSVVQVLDAAQEPERKSRPKRLLIVLFAGIFGLFAALTTVFFAELRNRAATSPETARKWSELTRALRFK